jgi:hypothetical protein
MPQPPLRRPPVGDLVQKAKSVIQKRPDVPRPAVAQSARERIQAALQQIDGAPQAVIPTVQAFREYVKDKLSKGEDLDDFFQAARTRAREEIDKRRHIVEAAAEIAQLCQLHGRLQRIRTEVIEAARAGQIRGPEVFARLTQILETPYPFLTWVERRIGPFTVGVSLGAKAGLALGVGASRGIAGLRHGVACFSQQAAFSLGLTAGADVGLQISVAPGRPAAGLSCAVEVGISGGSKGTAGISASFTPTFRKRLPTLRDQALFDWEYAGVAVSAAIGEGVDLGVALTITDSRVLAGPLP